ncbi:MAG: SDR family NAD(P)-dependent oxidoreductase, partial [Gemmatimonadetes bacterium]|nr:SDR family NAD(P)-dependent oxidoreductase [Gemmatimonadota bacterium]
MSAREQRVAVVTGASRGVGQGVAAALADAGFVVYGTGRTIAEAELHASVRALPCDHTDDAQVSAVFEQVLSEAGRLDVLVNSVWGGYETMMEDGEFTWPL